MKTLYIPLIFGLLFFLASCQKDLKTPVTGSLVGKWYVTKEEITQVNGGVAKLLDTTFTGSAFNTADYFQFNSDGTASVSTSGDFEIYGKSTITDGSGNSIDGKNTYTYTVSGQVLTLTSTFLHPTACCGTTGPVTDTIKLLDASNLVLHATSGDTSSPLITRDTYYTRGN